MVKAVKVNWTERPAVLLAQGEEVSEIEWMDTRTVQAIANNQLTILKSDVTYAEIAEKHTIKKEGPKRPPSEGPTKQERVIELVKAHPALKRIELITLVVENIGMTPAGAGTYVYNAQKIIREQAAASE